MSAKYVPQYVPHKAQCSLELSPIPDVSHSQACKLKKKPPQSSRDRRSHTKNLRQIALKLEKVTFLCFIHNMHQNNIQNS